MSWDSHYKNIRKNNPFIWPDVQVARLIAKSNLKEKSNVLDLGCGEGRNTRLLSENNYNVTAIDQSSHALAIVNTLYGIDKNNLICSDAFEALSNLKESAFDLVLCWGLMHYLTNPSRVLDEVNRILTKGSKIIISFNAEGEQRETVDTVKKYFSLQEIEKLLSNSKLKIIDIGLVQNHFIKDNKIESYYWVLAEK